MNKKQIQVTPMPAELDGQRADYIYEDEAPKFQAAIQEPVKIRYKHFCSMAKYAELKNVSVPAVYHRIKIGDIKVILVGMDQAQFIHWPTYKDLKFRNYKKENNDGTHN